MIPNWYLEYLPFLIWFLGFCLWKYRDLTYFRQYLNPILIEVGSIYPSPCWLSQNNLETVTLFSYYFTTFTNNSLGTPMPTFFRLTFPSFRVLVIAIFPNYVLFGAIRKVNPDSRGMVHNSMVISYLPNNDWKRK